MEISLGMQGREPAVTHPATHTSALSPSLSLCIPVHQHQRADVLDAPFVKLKFFLWGRGRESGWIHCSAAGPPRLHVTRVHHVHFHYNPKCLRCTSPRSDSSEIRHEHPTLRAKCLDKPPGWSSSVGFDISKRGSHPENYIFTSYTLTGCHMQIVVCVTPLHFLTHSEGKLKACNGRLCIHTIGVEHIRNICSWAIMIVAL